MRVHIFDLGQSKRHPLKQVRERLFRTYWFPVDNAHRELRDLGITVRHVQSIDPETVDCDVLILNGRSVRYLVRTGRYRSAEACCANARSKGARIAWFDTRDSAGNCQFDVIDHVDIYLKRQAYRDRSIYTKALFYGRVYSDYYHERFGVEDAETLVAEPGLPYSSGIIQAYEPTEHTADLSAIAKIRSAWTCGSEFHWPLFGSAGSLRYQTNRIAAHLLPGISVRPEIVPPDAPRPHDLCALFDEKRYSVKSVGFQRKLGLEAARAFKGRDTVCGRVPRKDFYKTLAGSKICVSVFGWGEVCYREYEATYSGSAVLMTDMSSIEAYPDFYQAERYYMPVKWDFSDFEEQAEILLQDDARRIAMAEGAQTFLMQQWEREGREQFARRFVSLITP